MRQGPWVIAMAIGIGATVMTSSSVAASPTASTVPPRPQAGVYHGRTSQGLSFSVRVANTRMLLSTARFGFRLHCAGNRTLLYTVSPIVAGQPWRLNTAAGRGFTRTFHDTTGERYWIRGLFGPRGSVRGTLWTSWHSPHDGMCRSGWVTWSAVRTG
jgi:hypothetical protein